MGEICTFPKIIWKKISVKKKKKKKKSPPDFIGKKVPVERSTGNDFLFEGGLSI